MERIPTWVIDDASGATEGEPEAWTNPGSDSGSFWVRKGLVSFGRANALYRHRYYACPECEAMIRPLRHRGRFGCIGCLLTFKWCDGVLSGDGSDAPGVVYVDPAEFRFR